MSRPIYVIPDNPSYNPTIGALLDSDPARAETVFNPLFLHIISNIHAIKIAADSKSPLTHDHDSQYDPLGAADAVAVLLQKQDTMLGDMIDDITQIAFELAVKGLIDTDGMKHVVVDKFETTTDVQLISGYFNGSAKKVYV